MAARVALRDGADRPPFAEIEAKARTLGHGAPARREAIFHSLADYMLHLRFAGLTDRDVAANTPRGPILRALLMGALIVLLLPIVIVGVAANLIPFLLVRLSSRKAEAVVTKGTVRLVVGMIAFPLTWLVIGAVSTSRVLGTLVVALLLALCGLATIWLAETARGDAGDLLAAVRSSDRRSLLDDLRAERATLVALVDAEEASP